MPRTQAEIWADIQNNNAQAMALQAEMNSTMTPPEPPIQSGKYQYGVLPGASRVLQVSNSTQLTDKLASAKAGDRIEVAPGNYDDTYTLSRDGEEDYPIMIHAPQGNAKFSKLINIAGKWSGVSGLSFVGNSRKIDIKNVGGRVLRCLFGAQSERLSYDGIVYMTGGAHPEMMIDFCQWKKICGAAIRCELTDGSKHQNMKIAYSHFLDHSVKGDNESAIIIMMDAYHDSHLSVLYNRFENCGQGYQDLGQSELESFKTTKVLVRGNTICKSGAMNFSLRVCSKADVLDNYLRDGAFISVLGDDHYLSNNDAGDGKVIQINAGNCTMDSPVPNQCRNDGKAGRCPILDVSSCKAGHPTARRVTCSNNKGKIIVGNRFGNDNPVKNVDIVLDRNSTKATITANSVTNLAETNIGQNVTSAKEMTAAMVGPNAPAPA